MALFRKFGEVFIVFFGVYLLYFNLVMALNVTGGSDTITPFLGFYSINGNRWTSDYYFGFDSIVNTINSIPSVFQFDNVLALFEKFTETLGQDGLIGALEKFDNMREPFAGYDIWSMLQTFFNFFTIIFDIIISPFKMLIAFLELNIALFQSLIEGLQFIMSILQGDFNTEVSGWNSPLENYFGNSGYNPNVSGATAPHGELTVSGGIPIFQ